jgi:chemotaxis protein methyltransferase CheR
MTLLDVAGRRTADMRILATDISMRVLDVCRAGLYEKDRIRGVPPVFLTQFFDKCRTERGAAYQARETLKGLIVFKRLNLSTPPFPMRGPMDVIFCRNVMIYFDNQVRGELLAEMYRLLKPGGYLLVGHAESLTGMMSDFKAVRPSIYTKP